MAKAFAGLFCCGDAAACVVSTVSVDRITTLSYVTTYDDVVRVFVFWLFALVLVEGREVGRNVGSKIGIDNWTLA